MRKYYLFIINEEFKKIYEKDIEGLFEILYNLYSLDKNDVGMGISIYNQVCNIFDKKIIINYLKNKYNLKKRKDNLCLYNNQETVFIKLRYSHIEIYSSNNIPGIFKIFYLYSKNIFIIDFENHDYFWLTKKLLIYKLR